MNVFACCLALLMPFSLCSNQRLETLDFKDFFYEMDACFLLYDLSEKRYECIFQEELSQKRFSPCSTFKILNTLIALEEDVLEEEEMGENLERAFKYSLVPFYQKIAKRVGREKYQSYLAILKYGNQDSSSNLQAFWLPGGSLQISPKEQMDFLNSLCLGQLPFSLKTLETAKKVFIVEERDKTLLSGKTGSDGKGLGWFIGYLHTKDKCYTFATLIKSDGPTNGPVAKEISKSIFRALKLL